MRNVRASGAIFSATERAGRELWIGISRVRRKFSCKLSNDVYIFYIYIFFFTRDFIFRVLGFGAIFRHSVF